MHLALTPTAVFVAIITLLAWDLPAQSGGNHPGSTSWGTRDRVEIVAGNLPIIIMSPHGGALKPLSIPDRSYGVTTQDARTQLVARELAREITRATGRQPHLIVSQLHRSKLDPNREIVEAAQGDLEAELAWREYHAAVEQARSEVIAQYGAGLCLDVHGHGHSQDWIEWGYALSAADLANSNTTINTSTYIDRSTIRSLARRPGKLFSDLLRGSSSLGAAMQLRGYRGVPSPAHPDPAGNSYFAGGYSVRRHGSRSGGVIDAVQIELPSSLRRDVMARRAMTVHLAASLIDFMSQQYGLSLAGDPRIEVTASQPTTGESGVGGELSFARSGDISLPRTVLFTVSGTARADVDYRAIGSQITFAAGQRTVRRSVVPIRDQHAEGPETLVVELFGGPEIGQPSRATVLITDDDSDPAFVGRWQMDSANAGIVANASGPNPAVLRPNATTGPRLVSGRLDSALVFDGMDDHLTIVDFDYAPARAFSLAFWFRVPPSSNQGYQYLFSHGNFGAPSSLNIYFVESTGMLRTNLKFANAETPTEHLDVVENFMDGKWHHYALTASGDGMTAVFVDKDCLAEGPFSGDRYDPTGEIHVGGRNNLDPARFFEGSIDELHLYQRRLGSAEVEALTRDRPEQVLVYGSACSGSAGTILVSLGGKARIDHAMRLQLAAAPAGAAAFLGIGLSRDSLGGIKLPFSLAGLGAPGCDLHHDMVDALSVTTSVLGVASVEVSVPRQSSLIGAHLYFQYLVRDPAANLLGLVTSKGLDIRIGGLE